MTDHARKKIALKRLRRQAVVAKLDGGTLTSDGGLLLREADRKLRLIERIDQVIPDPRDPRYSSQLQAEMLTSRIFGIAAGYEDGNDHPTYHSAAENEVDGVRGLLPRRNEFS